MQIYLVGGAVRDKLLHLPIKDRDWLVVGSTPEEMLALGYQQVGQDFPVFLHPKTKEEHALARTERKSGSGYTGFICHFTPDVTLEEDLLRRDLTINAIAEDKKGNIHDPLNGQIDLEKRILRHVSPAFIEDPLRVLRVARFAARFADLGFTVADETLTLMSEMSQNGELSALTPERVWQEWQKSLTYSRPDIFLRLLEQTQGLSVVLPELKLMPAQLETTQLAAKQKMSSPIVLATQLYQCSESEIKALCSRVKIPNEYRDLALLVAAHYQQINQLPNISAELIVELLNQIDGWRKPERVKEITKSCQLIATINSSKQSNTESLLIKLLDEANQVAVQPIIAAGYRGPEIKVQLQQQRIAVIAKKLNQ
ncbi:multifunctional CCA tRNA nucleotidyl transferase/2'3'-cyclic phosphodiesterase/2'nucleotidase/phosphatase [Vibrio sp. SS-MA-C1-2]|uniref:multifunctional CCA tRNA nucleotidyl transferase/2'3'-cyclic phosphodiesterase/2'nucleotidase/phosphatase n=1 Tax=Vibrio sp. SS-MA-C1-2 TaxID=2908646 RepID=UPI001F3A1325|nr:multifunctional CCA tRNA nucleotidyl transferase/2'3'-cyclic phosphodiesterase/2'nucleotidase/phosphatase [Vibrio sp. SS-MA-C1-2]UJF19114.1 multifunctional CCA tRNA nucleotidyl transferase/2'3'-cyclic phosphodiesterase/2'nucleotidase/phosphatase [Vibrio sp. SS-MA-C1-2]